MNLEDVEKLGKKKSFFLYKYFCYEIILSFNNYFK